MRSATEPPDPDLELFRSVRSDQVLRGCGDVFREKDEYTASAGALPRHGLGRVAFYILQAGQRELLASRLHRRGAVGLFLETRIARRRQWPGLRELARLRKAPGAMLVLR